MSDAYRRKVENVSVGPGRPAFPWTDAQVELLRELWDAGFSASVISERLGGLVSRSAVAGKVKRLKLRPHRSQIEGVAHRRQPLLDASDTVLRKAGSGVMLVKVRKPHERAESVMDRYFRPVLGQLERPFIEHRRSCCAWIVRGSGADSLICGRPVKGDGIAYCSEHHKRSVRPYQRKSGHANPNSRTSPLGRTVGLRDKEDLALG